MDKERPLDKYVRMKFATKFAAKCALECKTPHVVVFTTSLCDKILDAYDNHLLSGLAFTATKNKRIGMECLRNCNTGAKMLRTEVSCCSLQLGGCFITIKYSDVATFYFK